MAEKPYEWADGATLEDHSRRKHKILREYFSEYLAVRCQLPKQERFRLAIVDGFAGGGRYQCGTAGSPLIFVEELKRAIETVNVQRAAQGLGLIEIECLLILNDHNRDAIEALRGNIAPLQSEIVENVPKLHLRIAYLTEAFEVVYPQMKALLDQGRYRNVLFNLDQCGHSHIQRQTLLDIMRSYHSVAGDINPHPLTAAPSPNMLTAGSVIAASLITGLRSDLPGLVTAQVTERVFDSATGQILLIPQGARLIGSYDSVVAFGQRRALIVWQRIIFPDGGSIRLDNEPAADQSGYAGLADRVDLHTWQLLKGVALSTMLGVSSELALSGQGDLVQALRMSTQDNVARAGEQLTQRSIGVQPTITIRPGAPVRLLVHRDLILTPWHQ